MIGIKTARNFNVRKLLSCSLVTILFAMLVSSCKASDPVSKSPDTGTALTETTTAETTEETTAETTKVTEKTSRIVVDYKNNKYGEEYPTSIKQYDNNGKVEFIYSASNTSSYPLLYIYEDGVVYSIKLKEYIFDYKYEDLSSIRDKYDYKKDYYTKVESEYDANNKLIKSTEYCPNGSYTYGDFKKIVTEYTYNDQGLVTVRKTKASDSKTRKDVTDVWEFEYDKNGNKTVCKLNGKYCLETTSYTGDASVHDIKYDDHNNIIQINYNAGGKEKREITYNDAGQILKNVQKQYNKKGKVTSSITITNDAAGREIKRVEKLYNKGKTTASSTTTKKYNEHGDILRESTKMSIKGFDTDTIHEYKYDENGKMTYHHVYAPKGTLNKTTTYEYDSDGFLVKETLDNKGTVSWTVYKYWGDN